jgi:predicted nucleic-acid-binding protein
LSGRVAVDTNVLVRFMVRDDEVQALAAGALLASGDIVVVSNVAFAELVWVMRKSYRISRADVAAGLRVLIEAGNLEFDRAAVAAGLAMMDKGGDFADGVIHYEAMRAKSATLATFDRRLAARLPAEAVMLLGAG